MVVFTCNHCGESLQKPRVEKHYTYNCRTEKFLTCVDCFKDFKGNEYNVHTKCISEEQRYSGKDYVEKTKKGEVKQESWMEMIKSIIMHERDLKPHHKQLLNTISNYSNVPRKKVKFINFIKSSTGGRSNIRDIESIWDIIEKYKIQKTSSAKDNANGECNEEENGMNTTTNDENGFNRNSKRKHMEVSNGDDEDSKIKKPGKHKKDKTEPLSADVTLETNEVPHKKRKGSSILESSSLDQTVENNATASFSLSETITQILQKKGVISKEKLCKKILKKYKKCEMEPLNPEEVEKKINKKLRKLKNVIVDNNVVKLLAE